jgi:hypothetical protein
MALVLWFWHQGRKGEKKIEGTNQWPYMMETVQKRKNQTEASNAEVIFF